VSDCERAEGMEKVPCATEFLNRTLTKTRSIGRLWSRRVRYNVAHGPDDGLMYGIVGPLAPVEGKTQNRTLEYITVKGREE
jgi:hypothetical protein